MYLFYVSLWDTKMGLRIDIVHEASSLELALIEIGASLPYHVILAAN